MTPAFFTLVKLVSMIDESGFYALMQLQYSAWQDYAGRKRLIDLNVELEQLHRSLEGSSAAQRADIHATIHWIRSAIYDRLEDDTPCQPQHLAEILQNADDLVSGLSALPASAVETNGFGIVSLLACGPTGVGNTDDFLISNSKFSTSQDTLWPLSVGLPWTLSCRKRSRSSIGSSGTSTDFWHALKVAATAFRANSSMSSPKHTEILH